MASDPLAQISAANASRVPYQATAGTSLSLSKASHPKVSNSSTHQSFDTGYNQLGSMMRSSSTEETAAALATGVHHPSNAKPKVPQPSQALQKSVAESGHLSYLSTGHGLQLLQQLTKTKTRCRQQAASSSASQDSANNANQAALNLILEHERQRNILNQRHRSEILELMDRTAAAGPEIAAMLRAGFLNLSDELSPFETHGSTMASASYYLAPLLGAPRNEILLRHLLLQQHLTRGGATATFPKAVSVDPLATTSPSSSYGIPKKKRRRIAEPFPTKLYRLLQQVHEQGREHVISWVDQGRAFCLHDPTNFMQEIVLGHFCHKNIDSFRRQLNNYGFQRMPGSRDGTFAHQYFVRDCPELLEHIHRADHRDDHTTG